MNPVDDGSPELESAIAHRTEQWNEEPKPFVWHKSADEILDTLAAYCERISDSGHQTTTQTSEATPLDADPAG
jgi:hypothetical protein